MSIAHAVRRWRGSLKRPTIVHVHLPRCAGTSLRATLSEYADRRITFVDGWPRFAPGRSIVNGISKDDVQRKIKAFRAPPGLVTGHFPFAELADIVEDPIYLIVVRNPVERVASLIRFILSTPTHPKYELVQDCRGEPDLIYQCDDRGGQFDNGIARQLGGVTTVGELPSHCAASAWLALRHPRAIVTTPERLREGLDALGQEVGYSFPDPPKLNTRGGAPVPERWRKSIADHNTVDDLLYRYAERHPTHLRAEPFASTTPIARAISSAA
jgi:hypothetical protein